MYVFCEQICLKKSSSVFPCVAPFYRLLILRNLGHYIMSDLSDTADIRNQLKMFYVLAIMNL